MNQEPCICQTAKEGDSFRHWWLVWAYDANGFRYPITVFGDDFESPNDVISYLKPLIDEAHADEPSPAPVRYEVHDCGLIPLSLAQSVLEGLAGEKLNPVTEGMGE